MAASGAARRRCAPSRSTPSWPPADTVLGTSHRQPPVKNLVGSVRSGLTELFSLPDGWEIVLGNGGSTVFWDVATFGLIERSQPAPRVRRVLVEVRRGRCRGAAPRRADGDPLGDRQPSRGAGGGRHRPLRAHPQRDLDRRGDGAAAARPAPHADTALVAVDATSAAGGLRWDPTEVDVYYFAPQKCFASDGGLWLAACSPAAIERIRARSARSDRWRPASLDLQIALDNSIQNQTYNTPAVATLVMLDAQMQWMNDNGGLDFAAGRSDESAAILYGWAESQRAGRLRSSTDPAQALERGRHDRPRRLDRRHRLSIQALRANGVLDTDSPTASSAATSCASACSRRSIRPTSRPSPRCIDHVVAALMRRADARAFAGRSTWMRWRSSSSAPATSARSIAP